MPRICLASRFGDVELLHAPYDASSPRVSASVKCQSIGSLSWHYTNEVIAVGGRKITLIRGKTGTSLGTLNSPNTTSLCFSSKSHYLFAGGEDKKVRMWDLKQKQLSKTFEISSAVRCVSVNRNDSTLVVGTNAGSIILRGISEKDTSSTVLQSNSTSPVTEVHCSPFKSSTLMSLNERGDVSVWDITKTSKIALFQSQHTAPARAAQFSPTNRSLIVSGGLDKRICLYDFSTQSMVSNTISSLGGILDLSMSGDGISLCATVSSGVALLYDIRNMKIPFNSISSSDESGIVRCKFQSSNSKARRTEAVPQDIPLRSSEPIMFSSQTPPDAFPLSSPIQFPFFGSNPLPGISNRSNSEGCAFGDLYGSPSSSGSFVPSQMGAISDPMSNHAELMQFLKAQQETFEERFERLETQNAKLLEEVDLLKAQNEKLLEKRAKKIKKGQ